nr:MAG TPA: hypothetical protein [Caudoviricetes sp.]
MPKYIRRWSLISRFKGVRQHPFIYAWEAKKLSQKEE